MSTANEFGEQFAKRLIDLIRDCVRFALQSGHKGSGLISVHNQEEGHIGIICTNPKLAQAIDEAVTQILEEAQIEGPVERAESELLTPNALQAHHVCTCPRCSNTN